MTAGTENRAVFREKKALACKKCPITKAFLYAQCCGLQYGKKSLVVYSLHTGTLFGSFISGATLFSNIIDHELIFYRVYSQNRCQKVFNRGA